MIKCRRGSVSILALFMIPCIFAVGAMVADIGYLFCTKIAVKHKLNLALRGAAAEIDMEALQDPENPQLIIDETRAYQKFSEILRANLRLDSSYRPLAGSIVDGPVTIEYFRVVNPEEVPFTYSYNGYVETVGQTGVVGIISFPIKNGFFARMAGQPELSVMYVHATAGPELIAQS